MSKSFEKISNKIDKILLNDNFDVKINKIEKMTLTQSFNILLDDKELIIKLIEKILSVNDDSLTPQQKRDIFSYFSCARPLIPASTSKKDTKILTDIYNKRSSKFNSVLNEFFNEKTPLFYNVNSSLDDKNKIAKDLMSSPLFNFSDLNCPLVYELISFSFENKNPYTFEELKSNISTINFYIMAAHKLDLNKIKEYTDDLIDNLPPGGFDFEHKAGKSKEPDLDFIMQMLFSYDKNHLSGISFLTKDDFKKIDIIIINLFDFVLSKKPEYVSVHTLLTLSGNQDASSPLANERSLETLDFLFSHILNKKDVSSDSFSLSPSGSFFLNSMLSLPHLVLNMPNTSIFSTALNKHQHKLRQFSQEAFDILAESNNYKCMDTLVPNLDYEKVLEACKNHKKLRTMPNSSSVWSKYNLTKAVEKNIKNINSTKIKPKKMF